MRADEHEVQRTPLPRRPLQPPKIACQLMMRAEEQTLPPPKGPGVHSEGRARLDELEVGATPPRQRVQEPQSRAALQRMQRDEERHVGELTAQLQRREAEAAAEAEAQRQLELLESDPEAKWAALAAASPAANRLRAALASITLLELEFSALMLDSHTQLLPGADGAARRPQLKKQRQKPGAGVTGALGNSGAEELLADGGSKAEGEQLSLLDQEIVTAKRAVAEAERERAVAEEAAAEHAEAERKRKQKLLADAAALGETALAEVAAGMHEKAVATFEAAAAAMDPESQDIIDGLAFVRDTMLRKVEEEEAAAVEQAAAVEAAAARAREAAVAMAAAEERADAAEWEAALARAAKIAELAAKGQLRVVRGKNKLMASFDAALAAGYRDILLNVQFKIKGSDGTFGWGHICEIQLTLTGLYELKTGGGHAGYRIGRHFALFEPSCSVWSARVDSKIVEDIKSGMYVDNGPP